MSEQNENFEEFEGIIELEDEEGNVVKFELLMTFEYGEQFYVAMVPTEATDGMETDEVMLMRLKEDGDEDVFTPIETEEELEGAWNAFVELYYDEDEEDEEDEEDGMDFVEEDVKE